MIDDCVIALNKEEGLSSFLAVKLVSRAVGAKKAGHMGTLDPMATGVLLVGINKGTKLFDKLLSKDKEYVADFKFGEQTNTLDRTGEITQKNNIVITESQIKSIIPQFIGKQYQIPPQFSAKKINGQKACDVARKGGELILEPKEIEITELELLKCLGDNMFRIRMVCSSGTYVRCLGRDMASRLSTYCTTYAIDRTRCGVVCKEDAFTLQQIRDGNFKTIPLSKFL